MDIHYVSKDTLERMSAKRPHQVSSKLFTCGSGGCFLFFVQGIVLDVSPINFKKMDVTECDR